MLLAGGSLCIAAPELHAQNLIVNPGFETAPAQGGGDHAQGTGAGSAWYANSFDSGITTQTIDGWTFGYDGTIVTSGAGSSEIEWFETGTAANTAYPWDATPPHGGTFAVELNADAPTGRLYAQPSLTTALTTGATYKLSFWVSAENAWPTGSGVTEVSGQVTINGGVVLSFSVPATTGATTSTWTQESVNFVASGTAPVIRIWDGIYLASGTSSNYSSAEDASDDINLDDFSLTQVTPEPATLAGAFLLLGLVGWTERRRLGSLALGLGALFRQDSG